MNINFKYTAQDTLHQNYLAYMGFLVLTNKVREMMYHENFTAAMRYQISPNSFETSTLLYRLVIENIYGKKQSRYKHFFGK